MDNPVFVHNEDIPHIDDEDDNYEDDSRGDTPDTRAELKKLRLLNRPAVNLNSAYEKAE